MTFFSTVRSWFGHGGAIAETVGVQDAVPGMALIPDTPNTGIDSALQISTVWACIERRASTIASLPIHVYDQKQGEKVLARTSRLYAILHDSPNSRMTPFEFWRAMVMNLDLRGNAYARIDRDAAGEAIALWPMPSDQVQTSVLPDGSMVYNYRIGNDVAVLAADSVYHLKGLGNGTVGLSKLDFMRASVDEVAKAQESASKIFGSSGKPSGILMIDRVLNEAQRTAVAKNFASMATAGTGRLHVLEADMKYQQLSLTPEDQQLLETRKFGIEEICRWFDVPPVLVHNANVTGWGSGIELIVQGFYTTSIRPTIINIEQSLRKRVMTARQRVTMALEYGLDALLRGNPKDRAEINAKNVQNGIVTRAEVRQLEGWPYMPGTDVLTAQVNLAPLDMLGKIKPAPSGTGEAIAQ